MRKKPKTKTSFLGLRLREDQRQHLEDEAKALKAPSLSAYAIAKLMSNGNVNIHDPKLTRELINEAVKLTAAVSLLTPGQNRQEVLKESVKFFEKVTNYYKKP